VFPRVIGLRGVDFGGIFDLPAGESRAGNRAERKSRSDMPLALEHRFHSTPFPSDPPRQRRGKLSSNFPLVLRGPARDRCLNGSALSRGIRHPRDPLSASEIDSASPARLWRRDFLQSRSIRRGSSIGTGGAGIAIFALSASMFRGPGHYSRGFSPAIR